MVDSERASLERQLDRRRRNLCKLQEKAAIYAAGEVPLHLQNQIEAEQEAIADIKTRLDSIQIEEGEKEREPAERRKRSPRDWWASLPRETQVAVIRSTGVIIAALISLSGVLFTPLGKGLVDILLPAPTPIPVANVSPTPTPTPIPTLTSPATQTPTDTPTPKPTPTPPCPIYIDDAIWYENKGALLRMVKGADKTRPDAIKITFENPYTDSFSSWVVLLDTCDATESDSLSFWVRGATGGEQCVVGIKDSYTSSGDEPKVQATAPADWQRVSIPLLKFQKIKEQDLSSLENVSLGFTYALGSGTIYVDGFIIGPP